MSNNNTKVNNPMKVITGKDTRWSYANVWEAKSINGGAPKFSVSLIIPKSDTVTVQKIKAAIEAAYHEGEAKLKGNGKSVPALSVIKTPLRDGDTERPDDPAYAGCYFVNANSTTAPGIVDADRNRRGSARRRARERDGAPRPENPRRLTLNRKRNRAARSLATRFSHAAERRGFEPLKPFRGLLAFQAGQFNHSCIFPKGAPKVHNISRFCK